METIPFCLGWGLLVLTHHILLDKFANWNGLICCMAHKYSIGPKCPKEPSSLLGLDRALILLWVAIRTL